MKLKSMIEKEYEEYKNVRQPRITNLKEIASKQCCRYDGETQYSTVFQRWVDTKSVILWLTSVKPEKCLFSTLKYTKKNYPILIGREHYN